MLKIMCEEVTIGAWVANKSGKEKLLSYNFVTGQHSSKQLLSNQTLLKNMVKKKELKNSTQLNTSAKKLLSLSQVSLKKIHVQNLVTNLM